MGGVVKPESPKKTKTEEGEIIIIMIGKYKNKKGIIKKRHYGNVYTVEVVAFGTEIILFDDSKEMLTVFQHDIEMGLINKG